MLGLGKLLLLLVASSLLPSHRSNDSLVILSFRTMSIRNLVTYIRVLKTADALLLRIITGMRQGLLNVPHKACLILPRFKLLGLVALIFGSLAVLGHVDCFKQFVSLVTAISLLHDGEHLRSQNLSLLADNRHVEEILAAWTLVWVDLQQNFYQE